MSKTRVSITLGCCLFTLAMFAWAQDARKPGLWEMTTNMTWQKSPMPPGITLPAGIKSPFSGGPTTMQVCVTQAMLDKYGAPIAQNRNGNCQTINVVMKPTGMTAEMVCTGAMSGHGTMESSWTVGNVTTSKVHFVGSMQAGPNPMPIEWTSESTSTYKGSDCGSVKPMAMPADK